VEKKTIGVIDNEHDDIGDELACVEQGEREDSRHRQKKLKKYIMEIQ